MLEPCLLLLLLVLAPVLLQPIIPMRRRAGGVSGFPYVTAGLLTVNVIVFLATYLHLSTIALEWGLVPRGARLPTLLTHLFLHGDLFHLLGNMVALWLIGPHIEEALGRLEYLLFFLGCGMAAGLLHVLMTVALTPESASLPLVGASGAVFGLLGLFAVRFWRTRVRLFLVAAVPAVWAVAAMVLLQVLATLWNLTMRQSDGVSYWSHLGGFCFGALLSAPLRMREASRREYGLEDAEAAVTAGRLDLAAAHYRQLIASHPGDPGLHHRLGLICARLGQMEASQRHFASALTHYTRLDAAPSVVQVYSDALASLPRMPLSPAVLARVASACEELHQYQYATEVLAELARDFAESPEGEMALLRLGKIHLQKLYQPANAAAIFSEFLRLYPASAMADHARHLLGEAERSLGYTSAPQT